MAATRDGGLKAAKTVKERYGEDHYKKIGAMGGKISRGGGFSANKEIAKLAGKLGGLKSRKGKSRTALDEQKIAEIEKIIKEYKENKWRSKNLPQ